MAIESGNPVRVLLVDRHALFREGLARLLSSEQDFQVLGQAGNREEALELAGTLEPDLILLDLGSHDGSELDTLRALIVSGVDRTVVILTNEDSDEILFAALRAGARGYLLKDISYAKLLNALRAMRRGEPILSRTMASRIIKEFARQGQPLNLELNALQKLTSREIEVLLHLSNGASNRDIAAKLFISIHTVKVHVRNILDKLDLKNRSQAAIVARMRGLGQGASDTKSKALAESNGSRRSTGAVKNGTSGRPPN